MFRVCWRSQRTKPGRPIWRQLQATKYEVKSKEGKWRECRDRMAVVILCLPVLIHPPPPEYTFPISLWTISYKQKQVQTLHVFLFFVFFCFREPEATCWDDRAPDGNRVNPQVTALRELPWRTIVQTADFARVKLDSFVLSYWCSRVCYSNTS